MEPTNLENKNREILIWKIQIGQCKSENTDLGNTIRKRQIETYKSEKANREKRMDDTNRKVHNVKIHCGKYQLEKTHRKIHIGETQIGKYKSEKQIGR